VKQGWLRQEGSGGRGTKWYPTGKGKEEPKQKFGIEICPPYGQKNIPQVFNTKLDEKKGAEERAKSNSSKT
jgi:hypothetical protein